MALTPRKKNFVPALLSSTVQKFILANELEDEKSLVLKYDEFESIPIRIIAEQIQGRRKAKQKLPLYYANDKILYPPGINLEQSSSETTALFKKTIVPEGKSGADLTGGFGVDATWMSSAFEEFSFVEPNPELLEIVKHNHEALGLKNVTYFNTTAEEFLSKSAHYEMVYLDPSRRTGSSQRVFKLKDSSPDVLALLERIFRITDLFLLKTSPLLDLTGALRLLPGVEKVFVVSVKNECKELLFLCRKNCVEEPLIECVNIISHDGTSYEHFSFKLSKEEATSARFSDPLNFLYEPNASILKAGAFKSIGVNLNLNKLHPNTHLYTSDLLIPNFPGRIFETEAHVKPDPKVLKKIFPERRAHVITRNYPLTTEGLRKKTKVKEGGDKYLFGFTGIKNKIVLVATRIK